VLQRDAHCRTQAAGGRGGDKTGQERGEITIHSTDKDKRH